MTQSSRDSLMVLLLCVMTALFLGMGCSAGTPRIVIEEPEARLSPVMLGVGSIFMKIRNSGNVFKLPRSISEEQEFTLRLVFEK